MSPSELELLHRIEAFTIDGAETPAFPFASRLAKEHGWSRNRADRVVREYKRFVFLAMTSPRVMCPSEDVDAAWHLHLTYTRSYWKRFCTEVLGRPLHHEPTKGGGAEDAKHHEMYEATLAAYREAFGESPPTDIWPDSRIRFGDDLRQRMVNTSRNWVIPKLAVRKLAGGLAAALLAAVLVPGCDSNTNPFNLKGTDFLGFLIPAMLCTAILGRVLRSIMRSPGPMPRDDEVSFDWQQAAYLIGGEARLASAAVARLYGHGCISANGDMLERAGKKPDSLSKVEEEVWNRLPLKNDPAGMKTLADAVRTTYHDEAQQLHQDGYGLSIGRDSGIGCLAVIPLALVFFGFAVPRLITGIENHKPVAFLVVTMIVGGLLGMAIASGGRKRTTRRGDAILQRMLAQHDKLKERNSFTSNNAALAVALFGTAVLAGTSMAALTSWYPHLTSGSTGCSSGCSSSSGGGGDGGGGGCGGCGGGGD